MKILKSDLSQGAGNHIKMGTKKTTVSYVLSILLIVVSTHMRMIKISFAFYLHTIILYLDFLVDRE